MNELEFPVHSPGRTSLTIMAVLLMILCVTFPVAIYVLYRLSKMRVKVGASGLEAFGPFTTDEVNFDEVARFGVLHIPVVAGGIGGYLARMKLNHMNEGLNLVFLMKNGKTVKFLANQYDKHDALIERVASAVRVPREEIQMGLLSWKWPEKAS
jgi:hypothetical protein